MESNHTMRRKCVISVDDRIFSVDAILKASYAFSDKCFLYPSYTTEHTISVTIEGKPGCDIAGIDKQFCNELIAQMVRYNLANRNRTIKELVIGRALYSTYIDTSEPDCISDENTEDDFSLDDIAVNWFDVYDEEL